MKKLKSKVRNLTYLKGYRLFESLFLSTSELNFTYSWGYKIP